MDQKQKVLAIPNHHIIGLLDQCKFYSHHTETAEVMLRIEEFSQFVQRDKAESTSSLKQIISCAIIHNGKKILCIRRTKKSNRAALQLRWTVMIGGHVDEFDNKSNSPLEDCLLRELNEELGIIPCRKPEFLGVVFDPATPVGRLHIGIVHKVTIASDHIGVHSSLDNKEFTNYRKNNMYKLMGHKNISSLSDKFDPWSKLFFMSKLSAQLLEVANPIIPDNELQLLWV